MNFGDSSPSSKGSNARAKGRGARCYLVRLVGKDSDKGRLGLVLVIETSAG